MSNRNGPILFLEDDHDDRLLYSEVLKEMNVQNEIIFFENGIKLIDYLLITDTQPFLIISDVNLPLLKGTEVRRKINENEYLRLKSIPFIFLSTTADSGAVKEAYELMVQGYFVKESTFDKIREMMGMIIEYWKICKHPHNID